MDPWLDRIFGRAYQLNLEQCAQLLLRRLRKKVSNIEKEFIDGVGKEIAVAWCTYSNLTRNPGHAPSDLVRDTRKRAQTLQDEARAELTRAGVSKERQELLSTLLELANGYDGDMNIQKVRNHLGGFKQFSQLRECAELCNAPPRIKEFLELILAYSLELQEREDEAA